jgi:hypothetical protein
MRLLSEGVRPKFKLIECAPDEEWEEAEQYWIAWHREHGTDLTNSTKGGRGGNHPHSAAARKNISKALIGNTNTLGKTWKQRTA